MQVETYVVSELLQRLHEQHAAVVPLARDLMSAIAGEDFGTACEVSKELQRALNVVAPTAMLLRDHIAKADGLGEPGDALGELVLRAAAFVLTDQLARLRLAFQEPEVLALAASESWLSGQWQTFGEVEARILHQIDGLKPIWLPFRDELRRTGARDGDRVGLYRAGVRVALRQMRELTDDPDLMRFFRRGAAAMSVHSVHVPCRQALAILQLNLDAVPAPATNQRRPATAPVDLL